MTKRGIEIRPDEDGSFDEIVARGCDVHFEMMDHDILWVSVTKGKQRYHIWCSAKIVNRRATLSINCNDESSK